MKQKLINGFTFKTAPRPSSFRKDINALRALAVIGVVLYHFNPAWMPGGFAGVDVFFVISGYLMTAIIVKSLSADSFSFLTFYKARVLRIVPAMTALLLFVLLIGYQIYSPADLITLGEHVSSAITFHSNSTFLSEAGYFDIESHEKILLHTWSLSVEWQFYIIFPVLLWALHRIFPASWIGGFIIAGTIAGAVASVLYSRENPAAGFYLLTSRFWELLAGGSAFILQNRLTIKKGTTVFNLAIAVIILCFFMLDNTISWPGAATLIPVSAAMIAILSKPRKLPVMAFEPIQKTGDYSYSLYLWHWPVVVLLTLNQLTDTRELIAGILLAFIASVISYRFIEQPTRSSGRTGLALILIAAALVYAGGKYYENNGGLPQRFPHLAPLFDSAKPSPYRETCHSKKTAEIPPESACRYFTGKTEWAVIGDSHVIELAYALAQELEPAGIAVQHHSYSGCAPSYGQADDFSRCSRWLNATTDYVAEDADVKHVVLGHRYTRALYGGDSLSSHLTANPAEEADRELMTSSLKHQIEHLQAAGKQVYLMLPIPELSARIMRIISDADIPEDAENITIPGLSRKFYQERNAYILHALEQMQFSSEPKLIDPAGIYCGDSDCYAVRNSTSLYFDDDHPSVAGARMLAEEIIALSKEK
ncbi:MAG: hypothetical protein CMI08_15950 [Oceanospirillaceae bacterium]|mgnify:CR=1 FL=1|uniref:acyltransferase family protein n=3 Tax=unclassified Thalassolituus TaxID=2624967 RepID=UPI000C53457F|nr:acyltransferase family protein [Thalassolituus sp. UBA1505]MAS25140.1 hypothetical protein [Oceanospirillaceae bacterium]MAY00659.1 hypothetical protein [Oceanospirillaceae bacterium]MBL36312.1 hypothetical protein [Oceanospirillaceae bacterium]MBS53999.1 hypothetical protein [Oceanospirillaceae bacterium]|tara:strand:+ start:1866 stop:3812 length:1947 start_codon:yes stop_codon:yes gene_type:complete